MVSIVLRHDNGAVPLRGIPWPERRRERSKRSLRAPGLTAADSQVGSARTAAKSLFSMARISSSDRLRKRPPDRGVGVRRQAPPSLTAGLRNVSSKESGENPLRPPPARISSRGPCKECYPPTSPASHWPRGTVRPCSSRDAHAGLKAKYRARCGTLRRSGKDNACSSSRAAAPAGFRCISGRLWVSGSRSRNFQPQLRSELSWSRQRHRIGRHSGSLNLLSSGFDFDTRQQELPDG